MLRVGQAADHMQWLYKQGRNEEARRVLAKYHANGNLDDPLVALEFQEISMALHCEATSHQVNYLDFTRTSGNRRRLVVLVALAFSLNWLGNGIITYYLAPVLRSVGITSPIQITLINAGLAVWNLILAVTASVNVDKWGRRPLFLISLVGMMCVYAILTGLSAGFVSTRNAQMGIAVIPFLFLFFGFYDIAYTPLPIAYTVEILPYNLRTKGVALFTSSATLGNSFNQFVNPVALNAIGWK
jgi:MFS family permease